MSFFSSRLAVVTGGASGIGKAVCEALLEVGAKVAAIDVHAKNSNTDSVKYFKADISKPSEVLDVMKKIHTEFGQTPTGLVNCAGIVNDEFLVDMTEQQFDSVLNVNLKGTHLMCQQFARMLVKGESKLLELENAGSIVNIGSIFSKVGGPGQSNYSASKFAVVGFTKSIAKELAEHHIRVNAILPGFIQTSMTNPFSEKYKSKILAQIPCGRFGTPQEVADACVYLLSDKATYVTGSVMEVSGGVFS